MLKRGALSSGVARVAAAVLLGLFVVAVQKVQGAGGPVPYRNIIPAQLWTILQQKDFTLINVHIPYAGEIRGTEAFIPYTDAGTKVPRILPDRRVKIVLYCQTGRMSAIAGEVLVRLGYANVLNLEGGMVAWRQAGYPLLMVRR